jgi:hypothetical protein
MIKVHIPRRLGIDISLDVDGLHALKIELMRLLTSSTSSSIASQLVNHHEERKVLLHITLIDATERQTARLSANEMSLGLWRQSIEYAVQKINLAQLEGEISPAEFTEVRFKNRPGYTIYLLYPPNEDP